MPFNFFKKRGDAVSSPAIPAGCRVYAIGDVHGRLDLLDRLLAMIDDDDAARSPAATSVILLGDLIDRGPDSAGVIRRAMQLAQDRPSTTFLMGNHEEAFLRAMAADDGAVRFFCRMGGRETVLSYGVGASHYEQMSYTEIGVALDETVPSAHLSFLMDFRTSVTIGDYLFVHAGVDPRLPLDAQRDEDLRWIRDPFLDHRGTLAKMVVHGHTIRPEVEFRPHRIGIDTGAYQTGRLTALGLEGRERWVLQT